MIEQIIPTILWSLYFYRSNNYFLQRNFLLYEEFVNEEKKYHYCDAIEVIYL